MKYLSKALIWTDILKSRKLSDYFVFNLMSDIPDNFVKL